MEIYIQSKDSYFQFYCCFDKNRLKIEASLKGSKECIQNFC